MPNDLPQWLRDERLALGARMFALRHERTLTQERLGEIAGIDRKTINRIENGIVAADVDQLSRIARALGIATWRLFWG